MKMQNLGVYVYSAGLILALIAGLVSLDTFIGAGITMWLLIGLGVIAGLLSVSQKESMKFMVAAIAVAIGAVTLSVVPVLSPIISSILQFAGPAAVVTGLVTIVQTRKK